MNIVLAKIGAAGKGKVISVVVADEGDNIGAEFASAAFDSTRSADFIV